MNAQNSHFESTLLEYSDLIVDIPNYPVDQVTFKDITPLMGDPLAFRAAVDAITSHFCDRTITKVLGAEARGFIMGAPVAYALGAGFVPAPKARKTPS